MACASFLLLIIRDPDQRTDKSHRAGLSTQDLFHRIDKHINDCRRVQMIAVKKVTAEDHDFPDPLRDMVTVKQPLVHSLFGCTGQNRNDEIKHALPGFIVHEDILRLVQRVLNRLFFLRRMDGRDDSDNLFRY